MKLSRDLEEKIQEEILDRAIMRVNHFNTNYLFLVGKKDLTQDPN